MRTVTSAGDAIKGLYSTIAGGPTVGFEGRYSPFNQVPAKAIDNNLSTKYLNFGTTSTMNALVSNPGKNSGFYITPNVGVSLVNGVRFATGEDFPERDPLTMTFEGTNSTNLNASSVWTLLYNGSTGLDSIIPPARSSYGNIATFTNNVYYKSYRLLVLTQRGIQDSVQYAECQIMEFY